MMVKVINSRVVKQMHKDLWNIDLTDEQAYQFAVAMAELGITPQDFYDKAKPLTGIEK